MAKPITTTQPNGADRAAEILLEATVVGDKATCDKHGITRRTLQRWRKAVGEKPKPRGRRGCRPLTGDMQKSVATNKAGLEADWSAGIADALGNCIAFLKKSADPDHGADIRDPDVIHAVAGAMKLLSEVSATWKLLDVRIRRAAGQTGSAAGQTPTGEPASNVVPLRPAAAGSGTAAE